MRLPGEAPVSGRTEIPVCLRPRSRGASSGVRSGVGLPLGQRRRPWQFRFSDHLVLRGYLALLGHRRERTIGQGCPASSYSRYWCKEVSEVDGQLQAGEGRFDSLVRLHGMRPPSLTTGIHRMRSDSSCLSARQAVQVHPSAHFNASHIPTYCTTCPPSRKRLTTRIRRSPTGSDGAPHAPTLRRSRSSEASSSLMLFHADTSKSLSRDNFLRVKKKRFQSPCIETHKKGWA